jgi:hypothetical protein
MGSLFNIAFDAWDVILGAVAGYAVFEAQYVEPAVVEGNDAAEDVRKNYDPKRLANKSLALVERGIQPAVGVDCYDSEALRDVQLKLSAYKDLRRPDLRGIESGIAATAAQKLLNLKRWYEPSAIPREPEPEDAQ